MHIDFFPALAHKEYTSCQYQQDGQFRRYEFEVQWGPDHGMAERIGNFRTLHGLNN